MIDPTDLRRRIAEHLGWTEEDVGAFSLAAVRDLVTSQKLRHEINSIIRGGLHIPEPARLSTSGGSAAARATGDVRCPDPAPQN